jgi:hypothetical protein
MNEAYEWCQDYKSKHPCVCCGESDPAKLQFHHRKPWEKSFTIGTAVRAGLPLSDIFNESAKCDIVCKDCHVEIHREWERTGFWPRKPRFFLKHNIEDYADFLARPA